MFNILYLADDETHRHCEDRRGEIFARLDIKEKIRIHSVVSHKTKKLFKQLSPGQEAPW